MLCPRCSSIFDKKAAENIKRVRMASHRRNWRDTRSHVTFDKRGVPRRMEKGGSSLHPNRSTAFKPNVDAPRGKWVRPTEKRERGQEKWQSFEVGRGSSIAYWREFQVSKQQAYRFEKYKGKNPMSRSQWWRKQRRRKVDREREGLAKRQWLNLVPTSFQRKTELKKKGQWRKN